MSPQKKRVLLITLDGQTHVFILEFSRTANLQPASCWDTAKHWPLLGDRVSYCVMGKQGKGKERNKTARAVVFTERVPKAGESHPPGKREKGRGKKTNMKKTSYERDRVQ